MTPIIIGTRRDFSHPRLISEAYELSPDMTFQKPVRISIGLQTAPDGPIMVAQLDSETLRIVTDAQYSSDDWRAQGALEHFSTYGVMRTVYEPCVNRACGEACRVCDPMDIACTEPAGNASCGDDGACVPGGAICPPTDCDAGVCPPTDCDGGNCPPACDGGPCGPPGCDGGGCGRPDEGVRDLPYYPDYGTDIPDYGVGDLPYYPDYGTDIPDYGSGDLPYYPDFGPTCADGGCSDWGPWCDGGNCSDPDIGPPPGDGGPIPADGSVPDFSAPDV